MRKSHLAPLAEIFLICFVIGESELTYGVEKTAVFDFSSPGQDQVGGYETSGGAVVEDGFGMIALAHSNWLDSNWDYRIPLQIRSDGVISPAVFDLILDPAGEFFFNHCSVDGKDIRLSDASLNLPLGWWVEGFSRIATEATIRVKLSSLMDGWSQWFVYFGGPEQEDSRESVYEYSSPQPMMYAGNAATIGSENIILMSFSDSNHIVAPGVDAGVARGETVTIPAGSASAHSPISAQKPIYGVVDGSDGEACPVRRLAAKQFIFPMVRDTDIFTIISPYGEADVSISDSSGVLSSVSIAEGGGEVVHLDITSESVRFDSNSPVIVMHETEEGNDTCVISPPSDDIAGACAGRCVVAAIEDSTTATIYYSNRTSEEISLDSFSTYELSQAGSQGSGPAVRIVADKPVMALSYADGDGGEMVTFLPTRWLGTEFVIPVGVQYVLAAGIYPSTTCVLDEGGTLSELRGDTVAPPYPKRFYWGSTSNGANIHAPAFVRCDKPVWVIAERTNGDDEINLWPYRFFREPQPAVEFNFASLVETKYSTTRQWIVTPNLIPVNGVLSWMGFSVGGETEVPEGTSMGFQVSNDGGRNWYVVRSGDRWERVEGLEEVNEPEDISHGLQFLPVDGRGEFMVRVVMQSGSGVLSPKIDEIVIDYDAIGDVSKFVFSGLPYEWYSGVPFDVRLSAYDSDNNLVTGFSGPVELKTDPLQVQIEYDTSHEFIDGRATIPVTLYGSGSVTLIATYEGVSSSGGPIILKSPEAVRMEKTGGDNQFGPVGEVLPEPVVVRIVDSDGNGVLGVVVSFSVVEGGGMVSDEVVESGEDGYASVMWTVGSEPGPNRLVVDGGDIEGSPVEFVARADPKIPFDEGEEPGGGGCGCAVVR